MPRNFLFILVLFGCFLCITLSLSPLNAADNLNPDEPFSLEDLEDDEPATHRYKAALRLFAGVRTVMLICNQCKDQATWDQYEKRNGNSVNYVVNQFKAGGGLGAPQKIAVDTHSTQMADAALSSFSCASLINQIQSQEWDIYKGQRFNKDYSFLRQQQN
ncbi:MAG: hypothetical protein LBE38_12325 [Deltaproteobacteria bacterium]|nr:hypothetical protein [Deltaproteobacteria bacterium]